MGLGEATAAARAALYPVLQVRAGSLCVSVIHQTLTWTTGSITCVHGYSSGMVIVLGSADFRGFLIDFQKKKKVFRGKKNHDYSPRRDPTFFDFIPIMFFKVKDCRCDLFFRSRTCVPYFIHSKDRLMRGVAIVHGTYRGLL